MSEIKALLICLLITAGSSRVASAQDVHDPLEPARLGNLLCLTPNVEQRTCRAISTYDFSADGTIQREAWTALQASPLLVVRTKGPVTVLGNLICEVTGETSDIQFQRDGVDVSESENEQLRQLVRSHIVRDGEICARFTSQGTSLRVEFRVNGTWVEGVADRADWVSVNDNYRVSR